MKITKQSIYFEAEDCKNIVAMINEMRGSAIQDNADINNPSEVPLYYIVKVYLISLGYDKDILSGKQFDGDGEYKKLTDAILIHLSHYLIEQMRAS